MTTPTAAILIIGNEILSGRTLDTNTQFLCTRLNKLGIRVRETRTIPDQEETIIEAVRHLTNHYTYVFTTGGIGGTHDDITAECMAKAFAQKLIIHPEAHQILVAYYGDRLNEARQRMARMPEKATLIHNPISAAPGFRVENVFVLAGMPLVMQAMFETLYPCLDTGTQIHHSTITCALPENNIADELAQVQLCHPEVEIGSYPYFHANGRYGVSLVMRSTDPERIALVRDELADLIRRHGVQPTFE
jgi:molybdenum cofactor synthesis domain-containing protein